jgi:two-component system, NarL family, response regulator DevR
VRTLSVVLVDDHRLALDGLRLALGNAAGIEIVGETLEGRGVLPLVAETQPDVVLLDIELPDLHGLTVLDLLRQHHPRVTVVMFSGSDDTALVDESLRRGASAFLHKSIDPADLPSAIRLAVDVPAAPPEKTTPTADELRLTPKERQVLEHLTQDLSNAEIGRALWLSQQTVKFHLTNVYRKLGVTNRTEAARFALRNALVASTDSD